MGPSKADLDWIQNENEIGCSVNPTKSDCPTLAVNDKEWYMSQGCKVTTRNFLKTKVQVFQYDTKVIGVPKGTIWSFFHSNTSNQIKSQKKPKFPFSELKLSIFSVATRGHQWTPKIGIELRKGYESNLEERRENCANKSSISSAHLFINLIKFIKTTSRRFSRENYYGDYSSVY